MTRRSACSRAHVLTIALLGLAAAGCGAPTDTPAATAGEGAAASTQATAPAAPREVPCAALLDADLVPFDASGTALAFAFDYPEDWTVRTAIEDETFIQMSVGRSLRRDSTVHGVQFGFVQHHGISELDAKGYGALGYEEVDDIAFGDETVKVMGKLASPGQLTYAMRLPVTEGDGSQKHVVVTTQIAPASDRCLEERMTVFKAVMQTFRPNTGTS